MLVNIGLDLDAVVSARAGAEPWEIADVHRRVVRTIRDGGIVRLGSDQERQRLVKLVQELPVPAKKAWEVLLTHVPEAVRCCSPAKVKEIAEMEGYDELVSAYGDAIQVALVSSELGELYFGIPPTEVSRVDGPIEVARFEAAEAKLLEDRLAYSFVPAGTPREQVWSLFAPVAEVSRQVTVVDRFLGSQLIQRELFGEVGRAGASWFLGKLHRLASSVVVSLVTSVDKGQSEDKVQEAVQALSDRLGSGGIQKVRLVVGREKQSVPHDRHIRFGNRLAVTIGSGLDSFSSAISKEGYVLSRIPVSEARKREEGRDAYAFSVEVT